MKKSKKRLTRLTITVAIIRVVAITITITVLTVAITTVVRLMCVKSVWVYSERSRAGLNEASTHANERQELEQPQPRGQQPASVEKRATNDRRCKKVVVAMMA